MAVNFKLVASLVRTSGVSKVIETKPQILRELESGLKFLSEDVFSFSHGSSGHIRTESALKEIQNNYSQMSAGRGQNYTKIGINVDVGQGCLYFGKTGEKLKSYGFDTCAPFVVRTQNGLKFALGHIDSQSSVGEIVNSIRSNLTPDEIRSASFHYMRGAETF